MIRVCPNCGKKSLTSVPSGQTKGMVLCRSCKFEFPWAVMFPAEDPTEQASLGQATLDSAAETK